MALFVVNAASVFLSIDASLIRMGVAFAASVL